MKIGSPAVREALITLQQQGFVNRVANTGTYVNSFTVDEVQEYQLRIEFELLAFRWAKLPGQTGRPKESRTVRGREWPRRPSIKIQESSSNMIWNFIAIAGRLPGNRFLERSLENLVPPLFAFVLNTSDDTVQESVARAAHANYFRIEEYFRT